VANDKAEGEAEEKPRQTEDDAQPNETHSIVIGERAWKLERRRGPLRLGQRAGMSPERHVLDPCRLDRAANACRWRKAREPHYV
jgi:hypothetical protein